MGTELGSCDRHRCRLLSFAPCRFAMLAVIASVSYPAFAQSTAETPNSFFARGTPTFVVGTAGDERCDRAIRGQVDLIRELVFQGAPIVEDAKVAHGWPANPIVYGGAHVNALVRSLESDLPFAVDTGRVEIGGQLFEGDEYRLIAFVPATAKHPDFLLYAGAATPGVEEINAVKHGDDGFVVCDRFGVLVRGGWTRDETGAWRANLGPRERRLEWRASSPDARRLRVLRPAIVKRSETEAAEDAAIARGLARAEQQLGLELGAPLEVHVYPDRGSKRSLTGKAGDGHGDPISRTLHVIAFDAGEGGPLEHLVSHEATHVLVPAKIGPAGSPLFGEGLAVWVSGKYGGKSLDEWRRTLAKPIASVDELLGPGFRALPEATSYPLAGLLVASLVDAVGKENVLREFYGAGVSQWSAACARAGTSAPRVSQAFEAFLMQ
jgi:hypothetical protein